MSERRESAVGKLLRAAGVQKNARLSDIDKLGIRDAARKTGVSRQTLSNWMRDLEPGERRQYDAMSLDLVASGLSINRRELGIAAMQDSGHVLAGAAELDELYDYLGQRTDAEKRQILSWLAQSVAGQDAADADTRDDG